MEATVLSLWDEQGALFPLRNAYPLWRTPSLLRHDTGTEPDLHLSHLDQEASIIVLSDLGDLFNIVDFLTTCADTDAYAKHASGIGSSVGSIMALVHSETVNQIIREDSAATELLTQRLTSDLVYNLAVEPVLERVHTAQDPQRLYSRVVANYRASNDTYPHALSFGDFHPGSILLPRDGTDLTPILVDWEFAQVNGRGVNGDMAQFLASMHLELIKYQDNTSVYKRLQSFVLSLCKAYQKSSGHTLERNSSNVGVRLMRSAFILHGREMVNLAFEENKTHDRFQDMVDMGIWYLEHAGDDEDDFIEASNWEMLKDEDLQLIQLLFSPK